MKSFFEFTSFRFRMFVAIMLGIVGALAMVNFTDAGAACPKLVEVLGPSGRTFRTNASSVSHWGSELSFQDAATKATVTLIPPYSVSECLKD